MRELKDALEKFLNPNQLFEHNHFSITLSAPDLKQDDREREPHERINGEVKNQIFDKLAFKATYIETKIISEGKKSFINTELHHEGEAVFRLVERNTIFPLLENVHVVIYYLNSYKKGYFKRQTGFRSVDFGSIFLFLNGFRIAPYGDRGDDWLGLDVRKSQGQQRYLGSREIVGRIEIFHLGDDFVPISSREGLKNTDAFIQLREGLFINTLRKLERFVVEGLGWDSVSDMLRKQLASEEGLDWKTTTEQYSESWQRKQQRIALNIMTLIGTSPERIDSFWFNPALLEGMLENRVEEAKQLIQDIEGYESDKMDNSLKRGLKRIRAIITEKEAEAAAAKQESASLRVEVAEKAEKIKGLTEEKETYRAQTLFLQSVKSLDAKELTAFHHQINQDSSTVENYLARVIKGLRSNSGMKDLIVLLEKAVLVNKKIAAVSQFAIKANFRASTKKEPTDLPAFIEQYIKNVIKDFMGSEINFDVQNEVREVFEIRISRIELTILIDNIINNSSKSNAKNLKIKISKLSENTLRISFIDDGKGLSNTISDISAIFEMGFTTTSGSGLGLYHVRDIVGKMGGIVSAIPSSPKGLEIRVEVTR